MTKTSYPKDNFELTQKELAEYFLLQDGKLIVTKKTGPQSKLGQPAGTVHKTGYICVGINKKIYYAHRIVWLLHYGIWPKGYIDHINNDKTDNRIENLRLATHKENMRNKPTPKNNTSGVKGVSWHKQKRKWICGVTINGKWRQLGAFPTKELAAEFRQLAADMVYGSFARHA